MPQMHAALTRCLFIVQLASPLCAAHVSKASVHAQAAVAVANSNTMPQMRDLLDHMHTTMSCCAHCSLMGCQTGQGTRSLWVAQAEA